VVIDRPTLIESCGFTGVNEFQRAHQRWIEEALASELKHAAHWSEAIAVGGSTFVEQVQNELAVKARYHSIKRGEQRRYCANRARLTTAILLVKMPL